MSVPVNIFVKDTTVSPQPIVGVVVNVYNATTLAFITSGTTDVNGRAAFLLTGSVSPGTNYELRFFKSGVIFTNPKIIAILEPVSPPNTNDFDVSGTLTTLAVATDPRLCRCTGQFVNLNAAPISKVLLKIAPVFGSGTITRPPDLPEPPPPFTIPPPSPPNLLSGFQVPKILDGKMVSSPGFETVTDDNGRVVVDLIRMGQYYVTFAGEEDTVWSILVPDRSSANLIELIHPQPVSLTWNQTDAPGNIVTLAVGATKTVQFSVLFSNFNTYSQNLGNVLLFQNSDGDKADLVYDSGKGLVSLFGKVSGTLSVTYSIMLNLLPARIPTYSITGPSLAVTVT